MLVNDSALYGYRRFSRVRSYLVLIQWRSHSGGTPLSSPPWTTSRFVQIWKVYPWAVYCEGPPSFIWRKGGGGGGGAKNLRQKNEAKKIEEHFPEASAWGVFVRRFRSEEFSSAGDFGLGRNLRYLRPKTPHFSERGREGMGRGGEEREGDREGGRLTGSLWPTQCRLETQVEGAEHVNFLRRRLWKFDSYS